MKRSIPIYLQYILLMLLPLLVTTCLKDPDMPDDTRNAKIPLVETVSVDDRTATTITLTGNIIQENGAQVTDYGFCWATSSPAKDGTKVAVKEKDKYTVTISELSANATYFICAYATNKAGTAYGEEMEVVTDKGIGVVSTLPATDIRATSFVGGGKIVLAGEGKIKERGVCYATTSGQTQEISIPSPMTTDSFICKVTNLEPDMTYYVRAYVTNEFATFYGKKIEVQTKDGRPVFAFTHISHIDANEAIVSVEIMDDGDAEITRRGICWSQSELPEIEKDGYVDDMNGGIGAYSCKLSNLSAATTYYVRAYALNKFGISYGETQVFTTVSDYPIVLTIPVTDLYKGSATCAGEIVDPGTSPIISSGICWGTEPGPTIEKNDKLELLVSQGPFQGKIKNLKGNKTYYVRAYATNSKGTAYGKEETFSTPPIFETKSAFPGEPRIASASAYHDNKAYIVTGDIGSKYTDDFWIYDADQDKWISKAPYLGGIRKAATAFYHNDQLMLFGGLYGAGKPTRDFYYYDAESNDWKLTIEESNMISERSSSIAYMLDNTVYLLGGILKNGQITNEIYYYNSDRPDWNEAPVNFPVKQYGGVAVTLRDTVYAGLGMNIGKEKRLWYYTQGMSAWEELEVKLPAKASYVYNGVAFENAIYVIDNTNIIWKLDLETKTWKEMSVYPGSGKTYHCMGVLNDKIYLGLSEFTNTWMSYDPSWDN